MSWSNKFWHIFWHAQKLRKVLYFRDFSIFIYKKFNSNFIYIFFFIWSWTCSIQFFSHFLSDSKFCYIKSECDLTVNELKEAFFSTKINKSSGYDGISFNVVKNCFGPLIKPLMYIFNLSLVKGIFPKWSRELQANFNFALLFKNIRKNHVQ